MNLLDILIVKQLVGGGGGSGIDNYNELSNQPKINDVTLSGNKTASALGLQSEITSENLLDADLVDDTEADNKFVTSAQMLEWSGKQNAIDADHKINADYVDDAESTNKFVTAQEKETWNAKQNAIDSSHKLSSDLVDDANHTNKFVTSTEKNTWNGKQNAIDADHKLSSSLVSFSTAEAAALASGIDSTKVAQISTNQSNILYGINNTVKNICKVDVNTILSHNPGSTASGNVVTKDNHVYFTISDGEITINSDGSNSQVILQLCNYDDFTLLDNTDYTLLGCSSGSNIKYDLRVSLAAASNVPQYTTPVTVSHATESDYNVSIVVRASQSLSNIKIKPMLCLKSIYDADPSYQPYGAPNYDLTRLEAEDRAALAEEIDAGAKNKCKLDKTYIVNNNAGGTWSGDSYTVSGVTFTFNFTNGTISCSGTASDAIFLVLNNDIANYTGKEMAISGCPSGGNYDTGYSLYVVDTSETTILKDIGSGATFTVPTNVKRLKIGVRSGTNMASKTFKPMLCTKAAFGVSSKFVPYRPNYDLVCMSVPKTAQSTVNFSTANTYTYTGLSFTIPANQAYIIIGSLTWNTGQPTELILSDASDVASITRYNTYGRTDNSGDTGISLCTVTAQIIPPNSDTTMYLYAKNASSSGKGSARLTIIRIA